MKVRNWKLESSNRKDISEGYSGEEYPERRRGKAKTMLKALFLRK